MRIYACCIGRARASLAAFMLCYGLTAPLRGCSSVQSCGPACSECATCNSTTGTCQNMASGTTCSAGSCDGNGNCIQVGWLAASLPMCDRLGSAVCACYSAAPQQQEVGRHWLSVPGYPAPVQPCTGGCQECEECVGGSCVPRQAGVLCSSGSCDGTGACATVSHERSWLPAKLTFSMRLSIAWILT